MARPTSFLRQRATLPLLGSLGLAALAFSQGGCQILAGLGGEEPLGSGGSGASTTVGGGGTGGTASNGGSGGTGLTGPCTPGQSDSCYEGPAGTVDVGLCKAGNAMCSDQGMWGACNGAVLPELEACASTTDENCDGYDCTVWAKALVGDVYGSAITIDGAGNVYAAVMFAAGIDFGDGAPVVPVGGTDAIVLKYDKAGTLLWKKPFPGSGDQSIAAIAVDAAGQIAITGNTYGPIDFGTGPLQAGVFVVKLDDSGKALWTASTPASGGAYAQFVAIDGNGNVFAGGSAKSIDFGLGVISSADPTNFYVAKFDGVTGATAWAKISKGAGAEYLSGMTADPSNSLVLTGLWDGSYIGLAGAEAAPNDLYNCCGQAAPFLLRLDPDGNTSDGKMLAGYQTGLAVNINGIATDKLGVSTLVGDFTGLVDFQSGVYEAGDAGSLFVLRDQTSGFNQSSKAFLQPTGAYLGASGVALDGQGNAVIAGSYGGPADLGDGTLPQGGESKYVLKLDKDSKTLWSRTYSLGDGNIQGLAAGSLEDEAAMIGTFYGEADFGTGLIQAQQGLFIVRLGK